MNPYQSPTTIAREDLNRAVFRVKFLPTFVLVLVVTTSVLFAMIVLEGVVSQKVPKPAGVPVVLCLMLVVELLASTWFTLWFRVYTYQESIRCFDFWGRYYEVPWSEVSRVRPGWFLWLPYLRLYSTSRPPIWVPLFLHRQRDFWNYVHIWAPNTPVDNYARSDRAITTR